MRRTALALSVLIALVAGVVPATAEPGVLGFMSPNMSWVAPLWQDSPGVGARYHVMPNGERRFYVSGIKGLSIYNVDNPALPLLIGSHPIPNWENEDVSVSRDGKTVLMSEFTADAYYYVFTVTDPVDQLGHVAITMEGQMILEGAHIVDCVDDACDYAYGSDGDIYDQTDRTSPQVVGSWKDAVDEQNGEEAGRPGGGHNVETIGDYDLDGDGDLERVLTTDTTPITMLDVTDPLHPVLIAQSDRQQHTEFGTQYQHNNKVESFADYVPRDADDPVAYDQDGKPTNLRTGEILLGNGETNFGPQCSDGAGPLTSWSIAGWEEGAPFRAIETFRPETGTYDGNGNPAVNALGCSGHWFDTRVPTATEIAAGTAKEGDIMVAAGWYEHATRVFRVDGATGHITQLAYFQPVAGSASAAHWVVDGERTYIYTVDYVRGGDVVRFDGSDPGLIPSYAERALSWTLASPAMARLSQEDRFLCNLAVQR